MAAEDNLNELLAEFEPVKASFLDTISNLIPTEEFIVDAFQRFLYALGGLLISVVALWILVKLFIALECTDIDKTKTKLKKFFNLINSKLQYQIYFALALLFICLSAFYYFSIERLECRYNFRASVYNDKTAQIFCGSPKFRILCDKGTFFSYENTIKCMSNRRKFKVIHGTP